MSKEKDSKPFYMSEVDGDKEVLPEGTDVKPDHPENVTFVDIGHIQTDPKISKPAYFRSTKLIIDLSMCSRLCGV